MKYIFNYHYDLAVYRLSHNYMKSIVELRCNKVDTFWTLWAGAPTMMELTENENILYNKAKFKNARVAELADAQDLKS